MTVTSGPEDNELPTGSDEAFLFAYPLPRWYARVVTPSVR
jgi:hypothetical protein